ncbi:hypothetical protein V6N12_047340 [Hibiscus sabdariffa]|uniref:Uncharacterized protein n=1 Tax=Hibiscus sabdariffa TaxID=183260 RepID=A0ABR2DAL4_9ROSI
MRILISPSRDVEEAVNWVIGGGRDPDITLHMRMLMNRSVRTAQAALNCLKRAARNLQQGSRPRVLHFDYGRYRGNVSRDIKASPSLEFKVKDWGPAPRWVAFVDFFLASRAKHAVVSGAHRRVRTTYAQLIVALAAANSIGENSTSSRFSFLSSFQGNLLAEAWWEGQWQSPIPCDIHRLEQYGIQLSDLGTIDENQIRAFCSSRKNIVKTVSLI